MTPPRPTDPDPENGAPPPPRPRRPRGTESTMDDASPPLRPRRPRGTLRITAALVAAALVALAGWFVWSTVGRMADAVTGMPGLTLSAEEVTARVHTAIQREADAAFLVTGRVDVLATSEVSNTRTVLPGLLDLSMGTSRATVRVPGTVWYGVPLDAFAPRDVELVGDTLVRIRLPAPRVQAVEAALSEMEVRTERGWARLPGPSERDAERAAIGFVDDALREQGAAHLADDPGAGMRTARVVADLVAPVLLAAGAASPTFHVTLGARTYVVGG